MTTTCEICGLQPATVIDPASGSERARYCQACAARRQVTKVAMPLLGAAITDAG